MQYYELFEGISRSAETEEPDWEGGYDIIVSGGGSSGIYCAMSAAAEGRNVLLLEKGDWCGGTHIQGLVNRYYYGFRGGLYEETDKKSAELAAGCFYDLTDAKRLMVSRLLEEKGIDTQVSSRVIGVYAKGTKTVGVRAILGNKIRNLACGMLVDATSDGHVLRMLPVKTRRGRAGDQEVQPFSSVRCVYLDKGKYDGGLRVDAGVVSGKFGVYHEYRDNGYVNQYEDEEFAKAIIRAHASHLKSLDEAARFLYIAPLIGVREGVLFEGEQDMTLEQVLVSEKKPDNILLNCFSDVDKHGSAPAFDDKAYQDWFVCCNMSTCTVYIPVPVGSVVPKGWKGIITTGRCLSMDSYVNSAVRMNTDMIRMGEACGVLASMAMEHGGDSMAVPYPMLKEKLEGRGFVLDKEPGLPSFWTPAMGEKRRFVEWMEKPEDIRAALSTNCPGVALWSCRLLGKEVIGDAVYEMSVSEDEMLRYHAGVALGIMHDERALPILHEIIRNRKTFYFMDCRRSNQMRSVIAICLCGQMEDQGIVEELLSVIRPEEFEKPMYHELLEPRYELSIVKEQNSVYFQHFSHAVAALVKIAQAHEECREEIRSALHAALDDGTYIERITKEPEYNVYHQAAVNCRRYFVNRLEHETDCGKENG